MSILTDKKIIGMMGTSEHAYFRGSITDPACHQLQTDKHFMWVNSYQMNHSYTGQFGHPLDQQYGRYGYRRITALLRNEGWRVNHKRTDGRGLSTDVHGLQQSNRWHCEVFHFELNLVHPAIHLPRLPAAIRYAIIPVRSSTYSFTGRDIHER